MKNIYETIHTYKNKEVYGKELNSVNEALRYDKERKIKNLLKENGK